MAPISTDSFINIDRLLIIDVFSGKFESKIPCKGAKDDII